MSILKLEPQLANNSANFTFGNVFASNFYYPNGTLYTTGGGGGGTPGGSNTQVQFNNAGTFGGVTNLTYDSVTNVLAVVGNVTANYVVANGSSLSSITGANVTGTVANATYALNAGNAYSVTGGNVSGQVGNSLIAGTVYTNAQPNITSVGTLTSLTVTGNITGNYIIGNGSQLTGLPAGYADSNVATYLPTYSGVMTFAVANLHVSGGTSGQYLQTDGTGNLTWATVTGGGGGGGGTYITRKYVADGTANTYTVTSGCGVDNVLLFINGVCQAPTDDYTISSTTLTLVSFTPVLGTKIQIRELPR
jgi:hypothetical protein